MYQHGKLADWFLVLLALGFFAPGPACSSLHADEDRLLVEAQINGQPVRLAYDTGAEVSALFRSSAEKLSLRITRQTGENVGPGKVPFALTDRCQIVIWGNTNHASLVVIDIPVRVDLDGVIGWEAFRRNIIQFDCRDRKFAFLRQLPEDLSQWQKFHLAPRATVLTLVVPDRVLGDRTITIDTGKMSGVTLAPGFWNQWTASHPARKKTLDAYFMPGTGMIAQEQAWADELSIGQLFLHNVPVREANITEVSLGSKEFRACLGLDALRDFDFIVDDRDGEQVAYLRARKSTPSATAAKHNRIGAVFVPKDLSQGDELIARVIPGGPAERANVRDGDVLMKIDDLDATRWRTDPEFGRLGSFWCRPAGTKVTLTLKRGEKEFQTNIVLRDLIGPAAR